MLHSRQTTNNDAIKNHAQHPVSAFVRGQVLGEEVTTQEGEREDSHDNSKVADNNISPAPEDDDNKNKKADAGLLSSFVLPTSSWDEDDHHAIIQARRHHHHATRRVLPFIPTTCSLQAGYIDCDKGFVKGSTSTVSCKAACGGKCCVGTDACKSFTGRVCKDDYSCMGKSACHYANIPVVVGSCNGGYSCSFAAAGGGEVGNVIGSCNGWKACYKIGSTIGRWSASVGNITRSCNEDYSCFKMGYDGGSVGNVRNSCNAFEACFYGGVSGCFGFCFSDTPLILGGLGNITDSCNEEQACFAAGTGDGTKLMGGGRGAVTSNLTSCCNQPLACMFMNDATFPLQCFPPTKVRRPMRCWCSSHTFLILSHNLIPAIPVCPLSLCTAPHTSANNQDARYQEALEEAPHIGRRWSKSFRSRRVRQDTTG